MHFENRKKAFGQEQQSTDQTNYCHYDYIKFFQWYKLAVDTCTQCGPIFEKDRSGDFVKKFLLSSIILNLNTGPQPLFLTDPRCKERLSTSKFN